MRADFVHICRFSLLRLTYCEALILRQVFGHLAGSYLVVHRCARVVPSSSKIASSWRCAFKVFLAARLWPRFVMVKAVVRNYHTVKNMVVLEMALRRQEYTHRPKVGITSPVEFLRISEVQLLSTSIQARIFSSSMFVRSGNIRDKRRAFWTSLPYTNN
jgi:hypothetical protein